MDLKIQELIPDRKFAGGSILLDFDEKKRVQFDKSSHSLPMKYIKTKKYLTK